MSSLRTEADPRAGFSLEEMNNEAREILSKKNEQIKKYLSTIADAGNIIASLNSQIEEKKAQLNAVRDEHESEETSDEYAEKEIQSQQQKNQQEMSALVQQHESEVAALREEFRSTIEESQRLNEKHEQILIQEKTKQLSTLKSGFESMKRSLTINSSAKKAAKPKQVDDSKACEELEARITELTSQTREEMRDSRVKIDECLSALQSRRQNHSKELNSLDEELKMRKGSYEESLTSHREQLDSEEQSLKKAIEAENSKADATESLIRKLQAYNESQMSQILKDSETLRRSSINGGEDDPNLGDIRSIIQQIQSEENEARLCAEEEKLVDHEIEELDAENTGLAEKSRRLEEILKRTY